MEIFIMYAGMFAFCYGLMVVICMVCQAVINLTRDIFMGNYATHWNPELKIGSMKTNLLTAFVVTTIYFGMKYGI